MLISDWSSDVCSSDLAEVTKIDNWNNVTPSHFAEGQVGELPIIAPRPQKGAVDWRPVSQIIKTDVMEQVKIITPAAIMVTRLHLIDPGFAIVDCGDAVFDPGTEHEVCDDLGPPFRAALRRTAQPGKGTSSIPPPAGLVISSAHAKGCVASSFSERPVRADVITSLSSCGPAKAQIGRAHV